MSALKGLRRAAIIVVIASLVVAALLGIIAIVGGNFGELQGRILMTTLAIGAFGMTILCHLAIVARAARVVGYIGIAASLLAMLPALVLIWTDWGFGSQVDGWWKMLWIFTVLALSLAQANLLLLLVTRPQQAVRVVLWITLGMVALLAVLIILPIVTDGQIPGGNEDYWRVVAVVAILDVLGTITSPVVGAVLRSKGGSPAPASGGDASTAPAAPTNPASPSIAVPAALAERIAASAAAAGEDPEHHALAALERAFPLA